MPVVKIRGVDVEFPFEPYDIQIDYMTNIISALQTRKHAILESPTGTGKTLCLLCSTMAWKSVQTTHTIQKNNTNNGFSHGQSINLSTYHGKDILGSKEISTIKQINPSMTKIIYSSRTHGQIGQVIKELKNTIYRPRAIVVGSRQQLCINTNVSSLPTSKQNIACKQLCKSQRCPYSSVIPSVSADIWHTEGSDENRIVDIEDLCSIGKRKHICPYFLSHDSAILGNAELILLPYNYLIDPSIRKALSIDLQNTIILFDEAHNLDSACTKTMTIEITNITTAGAISEIHKMIQNNLVQPKNEQISLFDTQPKPTVQEYKSFLTLLKDFEDMMKQLLAQYKQPIYYPGEYIYCILSKFDITLKTYKAKMIIFSNILSTYNDNILLEASEDHSNIEKFLLMLKTVFDMQSLLTKMDSFYILIQEVRIDPNQGFKSRNKSHIDGFSMSLICNNSGYALKDLISTGIYNCIVTSGTLSPLQSTCTELQIPFTYQLQNKHVIKKEQLLFRIVTTSPRKTPLTAKYSVRNSSECKIDYGLSLLHIIAYIPGNVLVFFPSFSYLSDCIHEWKQNGFYSKFQAIKHVFSETEAQQKQKQYENLFDSIGSKEKQTKNQKTSDTIQLDDDTDNDTLQFLDTNKLDPYQELTRDFLASAKTSQGGLLFAVCRGKASEGIDFSNDLCRCVIVIGMPYPPPTDPFVILRKTWLDKHAELTNQDVENHNYNHLTGFITNEQEQEYRNALNNNVNSNNNNTNNVNINNNNVNIQELYFNILKTIKPRCLLDEQNNNSMNKVKYQSKTLSENKSHMPSNIIQSYSYKGRVIAHNSYYMTGSDWYTINAFRAVNQAIGRVIRHKDDYGSIILLDERYKQDQYKGMFSNWLQDFYTINNNFDTLMKELNHFFKFSPYYSVNTVLKDIDKKYNIIQSDSIVHYTTTTNNNNNNNNENNNNNNENNEKILNHSETFSNNKFNNNKFNNNKFNNNKFNNNNNKNETLSIKRSKSIEEQKQEFIDIKQANYNYQQNMKKQYQTTNVSKKKMIRNLFSSNNVRKIDLSQSQTIPSSSSQRDTTTTSINNNNNNTDNNNNNNNSISYESQRTQSSQTVTRTQSLKNSSQLLLSQKSKQSFSLTSQLLNSDSESSDT